MDISNYLPIGCPLQTFISELYPEQVPPFASTTVFTRVRCLFPEPHDAEQGLHAVQPPHSQFTAAINHVNVYMMYTCSHSNVSDIINQAKYIYTYIKFRFVTLTYSYSEYLPGHG